MRGRGLQGRTFWGSVLEGVGSWPTHRCGRWGLSWMQPTVDTVTYEDGTTEEVYGFDVPVPAIGEEFDLALIGKAGKWYDHKVIVTNPVPEA